MMTQRTAGQRLADAQHNIMLSQERLSDSQWSAKQAQESLSEARVDAKRKLEDLTRQVMHAALTEGRGVLSVQQARERLNKVLSDPRASEMERREARLSYQEAVANLEDVRTQNKRAAEDQSKAAKQGVEGSSQVQNALHGLVEAQRAVREATRDQARASFDNRTAQLEVAHDLLKAQQTLANSYQDLADLQRNWSISGVPGLNAYNAAMKELSPNAQAFVRTMQALRPEFVAIRKTAQDEFFGRLGFNVKTGIPLLRMFGDSMKTIAGALGDVGNGLLDLFSTAGFQKDYAKMTKNNADSLHSFGDALREFIGGFTRFAAVMGPLQKALSDGWVNLGKKFNEWAHSITPEQAQHFSDVVMHSLKQVGDVLGELIRTFFILGKAAFGAGDEVLGGMGKGLKGFNDFLESAKGQDRLKTFFDTIKDGFKAIGWALGVGMKGVGKILDMVKYVRELVRANPQLKEQAEKWGKIAAVVGAVGFAAFKMSGIISGVFKVFGGIGSAMEAVWKLFERGRTIMLLFGEGALPFAELFPGIAAAIEIITGPIGLAIAVIAALGIALVKLFHDNQEFHDKVMEAWKSIKEFAKEMWPEIKATFSEAFEFIKNLFNVFYAIVTFIWEHFGNQITVGVKSTWKAVKDVIGGAFKVIKGVFEIFNGLLTGDWDKMWKGIQDVASGAVKILAGIVQGISTPFRVAFSFIMDKVIKPFLGVWNKVAGALGLDSLQVDLGGNDKKSGGAYSYSGSAHNVTKALGGLVPGAGSGDTVKAMLTPGEFVLRKDVVQKIGLGKLYAMNNSQSRDNMHFVGGGIVKGVGGLVGGAVDAGKAVAGAVGDAAGKATMWTIEHGLGPIKGLVGHWGGDGGVKGWFAGAALSLISGFENYAAGLLGQPQKYDQGGWLKPGASLAYNMTGKKEAIMPEDIMKAAINDALSGNAAMNASPIYITVEGSVIRETELMDKVEGHIRRNSTRGSGVVSGRRN
jgi:hypothetical protein